ncbi:MAG: hypothetical protein BWY09_02498 [Candidatus Hydrogenedentes bacterium ADurb.Bin179]|nr:MAG: hypothetical protein BWY09_02498 [Candidatus Hydrogenedentes bacterium ADurb.Bin179]
MDGTGDAPDIFNQVFFRHGLPADHVEIFKFAVLEITRGEHIVAVHSAQQEGASIFGQRLPRKRMALEQGNPGLIHLLHPFRVVRNHLAGPRCRDSFQVFRAHDGAHARPARGALLAENTRIPHQVLARGANHQLARLAFQRLLRFRGGFAHQGRGIMKPDGIFGDFYPYRRFRFSRHDKRIVAGAFQMQPKIAAAVGRSAQTG